jgi:hypothetical protein
MRPQRIAALALVSVAAVSGCSADDDPPRPVTVEITLSHPTPVETPGAAAHVVVTTDVGGDSCSEFTHVYTVPVEAIPATFALELEDSPSLLHDFDIFVALNPDPEPVDPNADWVPQCAGDYAGSTPELDVLPPSLEIPITIVPGPPGNCSDQLIEPCLG